MLTPKQKMSLRAKANQISFRYTIGKNEISKEVLDMLDKALEAKELIKVSLLKTVSSPIREIALDIASNTHSEIVQIIGKVIILYRKSKTNPNVVSLWKISIFMVAVLILSIMSI